MSETHIDPSPNIGYKKLKDGWICTLEIIGKHNESRSNAKDPNYAKFRTDKVRVLDISKVTGYILEKTNKGVSLNEKFGTLVYVVGEILIEISFNEKLSKVCGGGIHYFKTYDAALCYGQGPSQPYSIYLDCGSLFSTANYVDVEDIDQTLLQDYYSWAKTFGFCDYKIPENRLLIRTYDNGKHYYGSHRRYFELMDSGDKRYRYGLNRVCFTKNGRTEGSFTNGVTSVTVFDVNNRKTSKTTTEKKKGNVRVEHHTVYVDENNTTETVTVRSKLGNDDIKHVITYENGKKTSEQNFTCNKRHGLQIWYDEYENVTKKIIVDGTLTQILVG